MYSNIAWNIRERKGAQIVINELLGPMLDGAAKTAPAPQPVAAPRPPTPAAPVAKEPPPTEPTEPAEPVNQKADDEDAPKPRP